MSKARNASVAEKLLAVELETAKASDEEFFGTLVRALARVFGVRYALVGELLGEPVERVRTLAIWANEAFADPFEYELAGTPSEAVRDKRLCLFSDHIQEKFPADAILRGMGVVSYLGAPLIGSSGQTLGVLVLMDIKPITWSETESRSLLEILAERASAALERQRATSTLRESEERFRAAFQASSDLVSLITVDNLVLVDVNEAFCRVFGYRRDQVVGRSALDLAQFVDDEACKRAVEEFEKRGILNDYRIEFRRKDGGVILTSLSARVVMVGGRPHYLAIGRDITEQVALARRAQEHEKLVAIGKIAAGIAHEVKNPLFAISSGLQLLMGELALNAEQRETLEIIFKDIGRIDRLVQQLQLMASRREPRRSEQRVVDLVREAVTLNRGVLAEKFLRLVESFTPDLPSLWVDRDRIHQVVINLLQNAVAVSPKGGAIEVGAEYLADRRAVAIRVRDYGPGVPEEMMPRIFEPFFTTKRNSPGLGLAICVSIAEEHGGSLEVSNHPDGGAVFSLVLPVEMPT